MEEILIPANVVWPPGYYVLRDRLPFFLTVIYLYKDKINRKFLTVFGYSLLLFTALCIGLSINLYLDGDDLTSLAGIKWSVPSPIEWGSLILGVTLTLSTRGIHIFDSFYMASLSALGGGWLYEFFPLLFQGDFNPFIFFKINAVKVFFIEFQLFCLPILFYIIYNSKKYERNVFLVPVGIVAFLFYAMNKYVIDLMQANLVYSYRWYVRLPAIMFLYVFLYGVKGEKKIV